MTLTTEDFWTIDLLSDYFYLEAWCELNKKFHLVWLTYKIIQFGIIGKWHDRKHPIEVFYYYDIDGEEKEFKCYTELKEFTEKCFICLGLNDMFLYPSSYGDIDCNKKHVKLTHNKPTKEAYLYENN